PAPAPGQKPAPRRGLSFGARRASAHKADETRVSQQSKVIWNQGLFMRPQHLQQQDRYAEGLTAQLARAAGPYLWGLSRLAISQDQLALGKLALSEAVGITPDGIPFEAPGKDGLPPVRDVPADLRNATVYLTIPVRRQSDEMEVDLSGDPQSNSRYRPEEETVHDGTVTDPEGVTMGLAKLRLGIGFDGEELEGSLCIPIAQVIEVRPDKSVVLNGGFIPSCIDANMDSPLARFLVDLRGMLNARLEELTGRTSVDRRVDEGNLDDFLFLLTVNRAHPLVTHLADVVMLHPQRVFEHLVATAGELATLTYSERRPEAFPDYRHDDLTATFDPVFRSLRRSLGAVLETRTIQIPLQYWNYGISHGNIPDRRLLENATLFLAVHGGGVTQADLRQSFAHEAKVAPTEMIIELVNTQTPAIDILPQPSRPRQLPQRQGAVYFALERNHQLYEKLRERLGIAVHVTESYANATLELWAVKNE
ncbi:MAG: type VI secretion system baseplate subunit TssK, partial [Pseudomonadota bacterium]